MTRQFIPNFFIDPRLYPAEMLDPAKVADPWGYAYFFWHVEFYLEEIAPDVAAQVDPADVFLHVHLHALLVSRVRCEGDGTGPTQWRVVALNSTGTPTPPTWTTTDDPAGIIADAVRRYYKP